MSMLKKASTLLAGVPVCSSPKERLTSLYKGILRVLETMPEDATYRKQTEKVVQERMKAVQTAPDILSLENRYKFQLEEMLYQAENELKCALKMAESKVWEPLASKPHPDQWKWPINN